MNKILPILLIVLMVMPFLAGAETSQGQLTSQTIQCGPEERTYLEYIPTGYRSTKSVPLVIVLHGATSTGLMMADQTKWPNLAEQNNFIVVFPNGHSWWNNDSFNWNESNTEVQFILAVIEKMKADYKIDKKRIYLTGWSAGGSMTLTFAFKHADILAAIAVASPMWMQGDKNYDIDPYTIAQPKKSMPIYIFRGALENWPGPDENNLMIKYWVDFNKIKKEPEVETQGIYTTSVYRGRKVEVRYTEIGNRTHFYSYDAEIAKIIWNDFFVHYKR